MTKLENGGYYAHVLKGVSYEFEDTLIKEFFIIPETMQIRFSQKKAIKIAHNYLKDVVSGKIKPKKLML